MLPDVVIQNLHPRQGCMLKNVCTIGRVRQDIVYSCTVPSPKTKLEHFTHEDNYFQTAEREFSAGEAAVACAVERATEP